MTTMRVQEHAKSQVGEWIPGDTTNADAINVVSKPD